MRWRWQHTEYEIDLHPRHGSGPAAVVNGEHVALERVHLEDAHTLRVRVQNRTHRVYIFKTGRELWLAVGGRTWRLEPAPARPRAEHGQAQSRDGRLRAPVPAQVREIRVQPGDQVQAGQVVAVLEAMKMEFRLQAPFAGVVQQVAVQPGAVVDRDQLLVEIHPCPSQS